MHALLALALAAATATAVAAGRPYSTLGRVPLRPLPMATAGAPRRARSSRASSWCAPTDACWPSTAQWAALNVSVGGRLIAVAPPLISCFPGPAANAALCAANVNNFSNSYWRASQPGAMQSPNLEQDPVTGADCFDATKPCQLGSIPPFAVAARSSADVSAALAFARAHSMQVAVKSTGHEYQGRR